MGRAARGRHAGASSSRATLSPPRPSAALGAIGGASSSSYTLASADVGHTIRAVVTASNGGGSSSLRLPTRTPVVTAGMVEPNGSVIGRVTKLVFDDKFNMAESWGKVCSQAQVGQAGR